MEIVGSGSVSMIVPIACPPPRPPESMMSALVAPLMTPKNVSSYSATRSPLTGTANVRVVCPGANVSVPVTGTKSVTLFAA
jgi:hypothetical protein